MVLRFMIFAMLALGLAGFGAVAWIGTRQATPVQVASIPDVPPPPPESVLISVLTAARPLRAGALVRPEDLAVTPIAANALPADTIAATPDNRTALAGAMLRRSYTPGDVLLSTSMMRPGDRGFLAVVLTPGTRAVSVAVDAVLGAGGLIWPGDHVDMLLTQAIEDPGTTAGRRFVRETVLSDLRIVAVDRILVQGAVADTIDPTTQNGNGPRTVTIEVTPAQAERVAVVSRLGRISFSVRAAAGTKNAKPVLSATWARDVSPAVGGSPGGTVSVFVGTANKKDFKF